MEIFPSAAQLKKGPEGQVLSSAKNFKDAAGQSIKNVATSATLNTKQDLPSSQTLRAAGETFHYPIETGNPAYRARVTFEAFTYGVKQSGKSQKIQTASSDGNSTTSAGGVDDVSSELSPFGPPTTAVQDLNIPANNQANSPGALGGRLAPSLSGIIDNVGSKISDAGKAAKDAITQSDIAKAASSIFQAGMDYFPADGEPIVDMYFPASLTFVDGAAYNNASLDARGGIVEGAINAGGSGIGAAINATKNELSQLASVFDFLDKGGGVAGDAARLAFSRGVNTLNTATFGALGQGTINALNLSNRVIVNPNVRALFGGVNLREFTFQFKMIATSQTEAKRVQDIIKHFRSNLYPTSFPITIGTGANAFDANIGFKFPNLFKIRFKFNDAENVKLPQIELAYLRTVNHTINPTGGGWRWDGQPNEIDLSLSFVEYRTLTREDIEKGF